MHKYYFSKFYAVIQKEKENLNLGTQLLCIKKTNLNLLIRTGTVNKKAYSKYPKGMHQLKIFIIFLIKVCILQVQVLQKTPNRLKVQLNREKFTKLIKMLYSYHELC